MTDRNDMRQATAKVLDPADVDGVLSQTYYSTAAGAGSRAAEQNGEKPTHYKVICISMYTEDLKRLDNMVDSLKARGLTKANRSALIRYALGAVNLETVPKGL
ncbi:MAG TPA: hypothetical protein VEQ58_16660 [Polyangiaceae bacterium]|nr:hypothetical protein [Polyangiaceae bacterium]